MCRVPYTQVHMPYVRYSIKVGRELLAAHAYLNTPERCSGIGDLELPTMLSIQARLGVTKLQLSEEEARAKEHLMRKQQATS